MHAVPSGPSGKPLPANLFFWRPWWRRRPHCCCLPRAQDTVYTPARTSAVPQVPAARLRVQLVCNAPGSWGRASHWEALLLAAALRAAACALDWHTAQRVEPTPKRVVLVQQRVCFGNSRPTAMQLSVHRRPTPPPPLCRADACHACGTSSPHGAPLDCSRPSSHTSGTRASQSKPAVSRHPAGAAFPEGCAPNITVSAQPCWVVDTYYPARLCRRSRTLCTPGDQPRSTALRTAAALRASGPGGE
jgi:hypothetical protein